MLSATFQSDYKERGLTKAEELRWEYKEGDEKRAKVNAMSSFISSTARNLKEKESLYFVDSILSQKYLKTVSKMIPS